MKILIFLSALMLLGINLNAQENTRERRIEDERRMSRVISVEDRVARMDNTLDLTDKQKADLTQYFNELDAERTKALESAQESRAARRVEAEKRQKANEDKLKNILGDKYEAWQKAPRSGRNPSVVANSRQNTRSGFHSNRMASNRKPLTVQEQADRLTKRLDLSEAQKNQLIGFFEKNAKAREQRITDEKLSRNERRLEAEETAKEHAAELEKILGAEKYKELIDSRKEGRIDKRR